MRSLITVTLLFALEVQAEIDESVVVRDSHGQWFEMESARYLQIVDGQPYEIVYDESASGNRYITVHDGNGGNYDEDASSRNASVGLVRHDVYVKNSGVHALWLRVLAPDIHDDSFFYSADGSDYTLIHVPAESREAWNWVLVDTFHMNAGETGIRIKHREDGLQLDRLLITDDLDYTPTGRGPEQTSPPPELSDPERPPIVVDASEQVFEMEDARYLGHPDGDPFEIVVDPSASGGYCVEIPETVQSNFEADEETSGNQVGLMRHDVLIEQTGLYAVWLLAIAPDYNSDSVFFSVDGFNYARTDIPPDTEWTWAKLGSFPFVAGETAGLRIKHRENGVKMDKLLIVLDRPLELDDVIESPDLSEETGHQEESDIPRIDSERPVGNGHLVFESGFGPNVSAENVYTRSNVKDTGLTGVDRATGYEWQSPNSVYDYSHFQYVASSDRYRRFVETEIVPRWKGRNHVLAMTVKGDDPDRARTRNEMELRPGSAGGDNWTVFVRYWMYLPDDYARNMDFGKQVWHNMLETKQQRIPGTSDLNGTNFGWRTSINIRFDDDRKPYWFMVKQRQTGDGARTNDSPLQNDDVPIPVGEWFLVEYFFRKGNANRGRIWFGINGEKVFDFRGRTQHPDHPRDVIFLSPFKNYRGNAYPYPYVQYYDGLEVWDDFPPVGM